MAEYTAPPEQAPPPTNGTSSDAALRVQALQAESKAAIQANDWSTAALKFEQILSLDPNSQFAQDGLQQARQKLGQPETASASGAASSVSSLSVRQLRMYIYVRRAVARLLGRERPPSDA